MPKKKLAVIASRFPYPLNKGDKLRLFHQIKHLAKFYDIYLYAINEENLSRTEQGVVRSFCKEIKTYQLNLLQKATGLAQSIIKREPIQVGYFYSATIKAKIDKDLKRKNIDAVYCQLSRTARYGLGFKGPVIFDYQDCFSKNYERAYHKSSGIKKIFYNREWKSMLRYEDQIHHDFVAKTIISEFDKESLPFDAENIHVIPNGVDAEYYKEQHVTKEFDILFSGNLNYQPNIEAALEVIKSLAPILIEKMPNIKIGIAGNTTNSQILNAGNENIFIKPDVQDMRDMYARTTVFIAPLFSGAGLQNKLLEAMSMGIPCIATSLTNQSLKAKANEEIIEVKDINELANAVIKILKDESLRNKIARNGQSFIHANYSWDVANEKLRNIIEKFL